MKLNDGEAKEITKDAEASKGGEVEKSGEKEKRKEEGVAMGKPTPNGVVNHSGAGDADTISTPTPKGKQKENEGGMISPESMGTT